MLRKILLVTMTIFVIVIMAITAFKLNGRYFPQVSYEVLTLNDVPADVIESIDFDKLDFFGDDEAFTTASVLSERDTYIFIKPARGHEIKVLEVKTKEMSYTTLVYTYTSHKTEDNDVKTSMRVLRLVNYQGRTSGVYSSGD